MDIVDLARRASSSSNRLSLGQLEGVVRAGLTDIVEAPSDRSAEALLVMGAQDDGCLTGG
jgi:hypothetical protein